MRRVFIADAHLRNPNDENYRLMVQFLNELQGNTKTLYILGDLFEFWIGYRKSVFPHYLPILACLNELKKTGTEIIYFEGNHDFHLGKYFSDVLQAVIYTGPEVLEIDGNRFFICHGDQINQKDYAYRFLRQVLHGSLIKNLFPILPPELVFRCAAMLSKQSKGQHRERNNRWDYEALITNFAQARISEGCNAVITAHFHTPFTASLTSGSKVGAVLSLGDWITHFTYGELFDDRLALCRFSPHGAHETVSTITL